MLEILISKSSLNVKDLSAEYKTSKGRVHALQDVTFSLNDGESLGIAGESACGKSTLGLSIIRMLQGGEITSGSLSLNGESILDLDEKTFDKKFRWKKISMIFQGAMSSLDPVFTIKDQFFEVLKQHDFEGDFKKCISESIGAVGLDENVVDKFPHVDLMQKMQFSVRNVNQK